MENEQEELIETFHDQHNFQLKLIYILSQSFQK